MITQENIQQTQSFLSIKDTVQQSLILKKDSIKRIRHGVDLATNTSIQRWIEVEHPSLRDQEIVSDLMANKNGK